MLARFFPAEYNSSSVFERTNLPAAFAHMSIRELNVIISGEQPAILISCRIRLPSEREDCPCSSRGKWLLSVMACVVWETKQKSDNTDLGCCLGASTHERVEEERVLLHATLCAFLHEHLGIVERSIPKAYLFGMRFLQLL